MNALPASDRLRLPLMMAALPLVSALLECTGYQRTRRMVERLSLNPPPRAATEADLAYARRLAWLAALAGRRGPMEATCLRKSLLVYGLLRRRGFRPDLELGVRREAPDIAAHAWVELEGVSIDPQASPADHRVFERMAAIAPEDRWGR